MSILAHVSFEMPGPVRSTAFRLAPNWAWLVRAQEVDAPPSSVHSNVMDAADASDIRESLKGDGDAFARIVRRHQERIAAYLWRFTRRRNELEELTQETFVQAYLSLKSFRGEAPLEHWLKRIATRVGFRFWKKRKREQAASLEARDWEAIADKPDNSEAAGVALAELLGHLPPRDRLVLTLLYVEGHSMIEAAALAGWSVTMTKVQAFRARRKLKALLEKSHG